jgi:hypothetical protein
MYGALTGLYPVVAADNRHDSVQLRALLPDRKDKMTLVLKPDTVVLGIWFVGNGRMDTLAQAIVEDGNIRGTIRFRYYKSESAWDGKDEKRGVVLGPIPDSPEERDKIRNTLYTMVNAGLARFGMTVSGVFDGGTGDEAIAWLQEQDFVHMRPPTEEEKQEFIKH